MTRRVTLACLAALCAAVPATAHAAMTGGASALPVPRVTQVVCKADCAGVASARPGSQVRIRGRYLDASETVVFLGGRGGGDDVDATPVRARGQWLDVVVPMSAASGPVAVVNVDGAQSRGARAKLAVDSAPAPSRAESRAAGDGPTIDVQVQNQTVFYGGERQATLVYLVRDSAPVDVSVELVRLEDSVPIARWTAGAVAPNVPQTQVWDGTAGGAVQKDGRYQFRVFAENGAGMRAQTAQAAPGQRTPDSFTFLRHKFPVRGSHSYGDGFGAGRGHQGADVFARCGTPLVAARAGVVKINSTHSRAGHYVVIDGDETGQDYVYMHLRERSPIRKGQHVATGQVIGRVGDTGRARGCHLHFELWDAPGWYTGGAPVDPMPTLKAWDAVS